MDVSSPLTLAGLASEKVLILGLGREGLSTYRFLRRSFPEINMLLVDDKAARELNEEWQEILKKDGQTHFVSTNELPPLSAQDITLLFKTPGLPPTHSVLHQAVDQKIRISSNAHLLFDLITGHNQSSGQKQIITIGITGTKGKSTTTSMIHHVLKSAGLPAFLGGNIGVPPLDLWPEIDSAVQNSGSNSAKIFVVLELSSHQLLDLHTSPQLAVIQNIVPEHLDYYATFEEYVDAKSHIARFQTADDVVIFNPSYEMAAQVAALSPGQKITFATSDQTGMTPAPSAWVENDQVMLKGEPLIATDAIPLPGAHNLENILPAVIIGNMFGASADQIIEGLTTFKSLDHRLELVGEVNGVKYYNDSLATVQDATVAALEAFKDKDIILMAGGYDRGLEFNELAKAILQHQVIGLILFRPTGERIAEAVHALAQGGHEPAVFFPGSMSEAVHQASRLARPGTIVLMSPASPSFGQFKDYSDRGEQFRAAVKSLQN